MTTTTLTCAGTSLDLPGDFRWTDEYDWHPVEMTSTYTTTGALILDVGLKQAGRPITLASAEDSGWLTKVQCDTLRAWAALALPELVLVLRGTAYTVVFDHSKTAFEARPLIPFSDPEDADWYIATLRLIQL